MQKLKMGMVGGGAGAFIGAVHRKAATMDGEIELAAGALSSSKEKALASGRDLALPDDRNYGSWQEMLETELSLPEDDRVDFVSVVTPNHAHFPVAHAFAKAGFNVVCDKPMVLDSGQAQALIEAVEKNGGIFAVTYNYTGYPMVKQARHMVREGSLGEIRKVMIEYNQGWLATRLEDSGSKQAEWRTDPKKSGIAGAVGDIGSHAENLAATITGLEVTEICADLTTFVPGRRLDDDANLLIRYEGGAKGVLIASQISTGEENDLRHPRLRDRGWPRVAPGRPQPAPLQAHRSTGPGLQPGQRLPLRRSPEGNQAAVRTPRRVYRGVRQRLPERRRGDPGPARQDDPRRNPERLPHRPRRCQGSPLYREDRGEWSERQEVDRRPLAIREQPPRHRTRVHPNVKRFLVPIRAPAYPWRGLL